jgi:hypothetical protein
MLKTKRNRSVLVAIVIFSMMAMYGFVPTVKAASMDSAKDTLSTSDLNVDATHTVTFKTGSPLAEDDYIRVAFAAEFGDADAATVGCPAGTTQGATNVDWVECVVGGAGLSGTSTITIAGVHNPLVANSYSVTITSYDDLDAEIESSEMKVYIISDVTVTAHVAASLTFGITAATTTQTVNGVAITGDSTATEIDYGTIQTGPGNKKTMAQTLTVSTNAAAGFVVTVQQDHNLVSPSGADIDSYSAGVKAAWADPAGTLAGGESTWGHMAVTSDDSDIFAAQQYEGLNGTAAMPVMQHGGASDGQTAGVGKVLVGYTVGITDLQEAGDYSNKLTYVCTPTF